MPRVLVVYDVSDDRARARLADELKKLGLTRIQRSAFTGNLDSARLKDLPRIIRRIVNPETDVAHVFVLCRYCWSRRTVIGRELEKRLEGAVLVIE